MLFQLGIPQDYNEVYTSVHFLSENEALALPSRGDTIFESADPEYLQALQDFSEVYVSWGNSANYPPFLKTESMCDGSESVAVDLLHKVDSVKTTVGEEVYSIHIVDGMVSWATRIQQQSALP